MWLSASAFRRGLYAEHHEELAYLYVQIARLRADEETPPSRVVAFEERLVAHLDALVIGGDLAAAEVLGHHDDDDPGHWYAAALLSCARRDREAFEAVLARVGTPSETTAQAIADALRHAMPGEWAAQFSDWIAAAAEPLRGWLADAAAWRGTLAPQAWSTEWLREVTATSATLVLAFGRAGVQGQSRRWAAIAQQVTAPQALRAAALYALALRDREAALELARRFIDEPSVSHRLFGLCGDAAHAAPLLRRLDRPATSTPQTLLALGLIGALPAVRPLVDVLAQTRGQPGAAAARAAAAATALHWIMGAGLTESVSSADVEDEEQGDDASAQDVERTIAAAPARLRPDNAPLAATTERALPRLTRLSRDPDAWLTWLAQAAPRFRAEECYRFGVPHSPRAWVQALADEAHGAVYRLWAADELALRVQAPHRLDVRATSGRQAQAIQRLRAWVATVEAPPVPAGARGA